MVAMVASTARRFLVRFQCEAVGVLSVWSYMFNSCLHGFCSQERRFPHASEINRTYDIVHDMDTIFDMNRNLLAGSGLPLHIQSWSAYELD